MTTFIKRRGSLPRNSLSGLKVIYRDLIRASEVAVRFYYGRPWETADAVYAAHRARPRGNTENAG